MHNKSVHQFNVVDGPLSSVCVLILEIMHYKNNACL